MMISFRVLAMVAACGGVLPTQSALASSSTAGLDVPEALKGPSSRLQGVMARQLFSQLPADQQQQLTKVGAPGAEARVAVGAGVMLLGPESDYSKVAHLVSPQAYSMMDQGHRKLLTNIVDSEPGFAPPGLCFAPGTDPAVIQAFDLAIQNQVGGRFQQTARWSVTATDGSTGTQGTPITLTYSFVPDGTIIPNLFGLGSGGSQLFQWLDGLYGNFDNWRPFFDGVFERWGELINVTYVYEPNDDGARLNSNAGILGVRGDVRIAAFNFQNDGNFGVLAYNNFPNDGDMVFDAFDTFYNSTFNNSIRLRNVIAHEHGHGLGMLHVCPQNGTKLMEPSANTNFDGPQLDDQLNGQRHYGDLNEPNDSFGAATNLGTIGIGDTALESDRSIDDNSDTDFYAVTIPSATTLRIVVNPAASSYLNGSQNANGSCSAGVTFDYNSVHDLAIQIFDTDGTTLLDTIDNAAAGGLELDTFDFQVPGTYYLRVIGDATNNIQLYNLQVFGQSVPFLTPLIDVTGGVPDNVDPGVDTTFTVSIDPQQDTLVPGTAKFFYRTGNSGPFTEQVMADLGGNQFEATLPAPACGDFPEFYFSVESDQTGITLDPPNGDTTPYVVAVGDLVVALVDDFESDQGWVVSGTAQFATQGRWERVTPSDPGSVGQPTVDFDGSGQAFITGNGTGNTDIDTDSVLTSPVLDLAGQSGATISYARWFDDVDAASPGGGTLVVDVSNDAGSTWTQVEVINEFTTPNDADGGWIEQSFTVADFVTPTDQIVVRFTVSDLTGNSVVEAGIDAFDARAGECIDPVDCPADLADPPGQLDIFDVLAYLALFDVNDPAADLAEPFGDFNIFDVLAYLALFDAGC